MLMSCVFLVLFLVLDKFWSRFGFLGPIWVTFVAGLRLKLCFMVYSYILAGRVRISSIKLNSGQLQ